MKVGQAEFVVSATKPAGFPGEGLPEVSFAGRSNVGKSSLINSLLGRKKLAKTSSTPGRTRLINFFRVNNKYMFADLPGYGYAKVSKKMRQSWQPMVEGYLRSRDDLRVVILIQDIRRIPGKEEIDLIGYLTGMGIPPLVVVTKADKLSRNKRVKPLREISKALGIPVPDLMVYSAQTGEGRDALWSRLKDFLDN